jgi:hypothetical protein
MLMTTAACCALTAGAGTAATAATGAAARGAAGAAGAAARVVAAPTGHWGNARQVPGLETLNTDGDSWVQSISCVLPGECGAGGTYQAGGTDHAFIALETGGTWEKARPFADAPDITASMVTSVSCGAPDVCTAGGWYSQPGSIQLAFIAMVNGGSTDAIEVPGTPLTKGGSAQVSAVSCADSLDCTAGGNSNDPVAGIQQPFVADQVNGVWGTAHPLDGISGLNQSGRAVIIALSCPSPGDCLATGTYGDADRVTHAFEAEESDGSWGPARPVPGIDLLTPYISEPMSASCAAPGECSIAGFYIDGAKKKQQAWVADEHGGTWGLARAVPGTLARNTLGNAALNYVSCPSPGNCAAVGRYTVFPGFGHNFVTGEQGGVWQPDVRDLTLNGASVGGTGVNAEAVSCASAGNCAVIGEYNDPRNGVHLFVLTDVNGTWGTARELPGSAALNQKLFARLESVSCASAGNCAVGGFYMDAHGAIRALVADLSTVTSARVALSAATVRFGHEQAERISARVISRTGGTPGGQVSIAAGRQVLCVIKLAGGKGTCALPAKRLKPGSYHVTALYGGSQVYSGSVAGAKTTLTVTR